LKTASTWLPVVTTTNGNPIRMLKNSTIEAIDHQRLIRTDKGINATTSPGRNHQPIRPPAMMAPTWPMVEGTASASAAAATAIVARSRSGQRFRAMPQTACATTATATILSPCSHAAPPRLPNAATP
jgi:hypothetical protein